MFPPFMDSLGYVILKTSMVICSYERHIITAITIHAYSQYRIT